MVAQRLVAPEPVEDDPEVPVGHRVAEEQEVAPAELRSERDGNSGRDVRLREEVDVVVLRNDEALPLPRGGTLDLAGAPTVVDGLVYFSTCGSCSSYESNPRARRTFALDAVTGRLVWRFPDGEYSPVIADRERLYLTGFTSLYGLAPTG